MKYADIDLPLEYICEWAEAEALSPLPFLLIWINVTDYLTSESVTFCHSGGGKTVILLPWRLQINSIMQYLLVHSQWAGSVSAVVIGAGGGAEELESPGLWLALVDNELPLKFFWPVYRGGVSVPDRAHASCINTQHNWAADQTHQFKERRCLPVAVRLVAQLHFRFAWAYCAALEKKRQ